VSKEPAIDGGEGLREGKNEGVVDAIVVKKEQEMKP
jgi:hypothetical protein